MFTTIILLNKLSIYVIIICGSDFMNLPDLKEAKVRTNKEIKIIRDDYKVPENMKKIGEGKKYYLKTYG